jgi:beta-glucanase (GH16 family)
MAFWLCLLAILVSFPVMGTAFASAAGTTAPAGPAGKTLIFDDEFNAPRLDFTKWITRLEWGRTSPPELEYYSPSAFVFGGGKLWIQAQKKSSHGMPYVSGIINSYTKFQFTYGYVEARVQVPAGKGLWPAFWLLSSTGSIDEIDIMEILCDKPRTAYLTMHYLDGNGKPQGPGTSYRGPNFSAGYHIFAVDWEPGLVIWYIDGVERFRLAHNVPTVPMYVMANLAVGGNWPGSPDKFTHFPAYYKIDYIRVYQ